MERLFVYGTLKEGFSNHYLLSNFEKVDEGFLGGFDLYENRIPFVYRSKDKNNKVFGEIYEVPMSHIQRHVDPLEGHPFFYTRTFIPDQLSGVWIYLSNTDKTNLTKNHSGVY